MQLDGVQRRSSTSSSRLPVNPRRHKVAPEQRKRVATACNNCNVRRIKCSGDRPCSQCASSSRDCVYPVTIDKITVAKTELEELRKKAEIYEKALQDALPDSAQRQDLLQHIAATAVSPDSSPSPSPFTPGVASSIKTEPTTEGGLDSGLVTPARPLRDHCGRTRFLGETSGAVFLDQIKEILSAMLPPIPVQTQPSTVRDGRGFISSLGSYQTNDSNPLPEPDVDPLWLPSRNTVGAMLTELRHMIQDGNGEWPSGGIYWWGELGSDPSPASASPSLQTDLNKFRHLAFYHTTLAIASHNPSSIAAGKRRSSQENDDTDPTPSEAFFARATQLIGNPLDTTRCTIGDVAVLALMSFYLLEVNRRDAASMYVAAAMHISVMLGAHTGWADEGAKRVFWTVYVLDRWLSCLMGRPPTLADDAIQLPLPADAPSMPPAAGLRAHVELSRISGQIVTDMHQNPGEASRSPERALWALQQWQAALPARLQLTSDGLSSDPASCLLHMRCNQLLIVATRPLFLTAVKKFVAERFASQQSPAAGAGAETSPSPHLRSCIGAARRNIRLARQLVALDRRGNLMHAGLHFLFNATVCLILQDLVYDQDVSSAQDFAARNRDIDFAIERLELDGRGYADMLQDLRALVAKLADIDTTIDPMLEVAAGSSSSLQTGGDPMLYGEPVPWIDEDWPMYNICMDS